MPPPSWMRNKGVRDVRELAGRGRAGGWIKVGFVSNMFYTNPGVRKDVGFADC